MLQLLPTATLVLTLLTGLGCERSGGASGGGKPTVVATTTMIGDLVRQIGGENVELRVIMGSGVDPHTYKPSPADFASLKTATLIFYNGLHLEGKMVELFEERLKDRAIAVTRDMPVDKLLAWQAGQGGAYDPHVWFDIPLWMQAARTVAAELARIDPAGAEEYARRLERTLADMQTLHEQLAQQLARVPESRRVVITSHDAFNYFGRTYGFEVRGLQGISTETEAGLLAVQGAVDFIVARKIPAVFVESSVSPKTIQRVRDDCAGRGWPVEIGGELYSDAMGTPGEHPGYAVETYAGMMRYNVDTIVAALSR